MDLAHFFDHTLLKPDCNTSDVKQICSEAIQYGFAAVCIPPYHVAFAAQELENTGVKVATVAGFPLGYSATAAKVEEIKRAIGEGADELDVVVNLAAIKSGAWSFVKDDIDRMTTAVDLKGKLIKVILETSLLTETEIRKLCSICLEIKPNFIKTSTGFSGGGATVEIVRLLKEIVEDKIKIKASAGIRTREDAEQLLAAGAQRLGSSNSVMIVKEL